MKHVIIGTAGHIDHGKSALVRALTGTDPDRLKEEKERGITIDLGFAFLSGETPSGPLDLGFVDVPGHERFVKNMLAGVGGIDLVMLVVAADESVMPQTREHFEICRLLRVRRGLIAVTKIDLVEPDMRELVAMEVRELVAGSFLAEAPLVFVSSRSGEGIDALRDRLFDLAASVESRSASGLFRLPVDRVFSMRGFGTVVTGTLISGSVGEDEVVEIVPRGLTSRVRGLQVHGQKVKEAFAGQRTAMNLQGVEVSEILRGETVIRPLTLAATLMLDAELEVLASSPVPIRDLSRVHLHMGTAQVVARVRVLGGGKAIPPGESGWVQLRLEAPVVAVPGDRFILRRYSPLETVAGGVVLDAAPLKHIVSRPEVIDTLRLLGRGDPAEAIVHHTEEAGAAGISGPALSRRVGRDETSLEKLVAGLAREGRVCRVAEKPLLLVSPRWVAEASQRIRQELERFQARNPLREGMPRGELRERVLGKSPPEVFEWILESLVRAGQVKALRDRVATSDHRIQLTEDEARAREFLARAFREAGYQPPSLPELGARGRFDVTLLERIERLLLQEGALVKVSDGMVFHHDVLEELKQEIQRHKQKGDRIDVAFFKQLAGVTRKHAIPLLEWLDRERITRRVGNERVIL